MHLRCIADAEFLEYLKLKKNEFINLPTNLNFIESNEFELLTVKGQSDIQRSP